MNSPSDQDEAAAEALATRELVLIALEGVERLALGDRGGSLLARALERVSTQPPSEVAGGEESAEVAARARALVLGELKGLLDSVQGQGTRPGKRIGPHETQSRPRGRAGFPG